jgi:uncharacterized membrane protein YfcA
MTPLLLLIGLPPTATVATDLAYSALTKLAGTVQQDVQMGVAGLLLFGSIPGVLLGSGIASVPRKPLQIVVAGLLLMTAWSLLR